MALISTYDCQDTIQQAVLIYGGLTGVNPLISLLFEDPQERVDILYVFELLIELIEQPRTRVPDWLLHQPMAGSAGT